MLFFLYRKRSRIYSSIFCVNFCHEDNVVISICIGVFFFKYFQAKLCITDFCIMYCSDIWTEPNILYYLITKTFKNRWWCERSWFKQVWTCHFHMQTTGACTHTRKLSLLESDCVWEEKEKKHKFVNTEFHIKKY